MCGIIYQSTVCHSLVEGFLHAFFQVFQSISTMHQVYNFGFKWLLMVPFFLLWGVASYGQSPSNGNVESKATLESSPDKGALPSNGKQWHTANAAEIEGFSRCALETEKAYADRLSKNLTALRQHPALLSVNYDANRMQLQLEWREEQSDPSSQLKLLSESIQPYSSSSQSHSR